MISHDIRILAIIVSYNSEKWIRKNLSSIGNDADILVLDNGSADETVEIITKEFPNVRLIQNQCNLGFAAANNIGFEIAKKENYDWVFLVNHDGWLLGDFWSAVRPVLETNADFGLLSPMHLDATGNDYDFGFKKYLPQPFIPDRDRPVEIKKINGAFLFISRHCLKAVNGFDPIFFFYGEDEDLCGRVTNGGFKIGLITKAYVVHDRKERRMNKERLARHVYANSLLQIKENTGKIFLVVFLKTIYSNIILLQSKNEDLGELRNIYIKNILKLLRNFNSIKTSYFLYQ